MQTFPIDHTVPMHYLARCFNSTSATYKFYWLLAILDAVQNQQQEIRKESLFASMLSNAWYTVNYFNVSFGQQDLIQTRVKKLKDIEHITIDEQRNVILDKLVQSDRREAKG